jgi:hypothetical protein
MTYLSSDASLFLNALYRVSVVIITSGEPILPFFTRQAETSDLAIFVGLEVHEPKSVYFSLTRCGEYGVVADSVP